MTTTQINVHLSDRRVMPARYNVLAYQHLLTRSLLLSVFSLVGSRGEPKCHHIKFANLIRLNPSLSSGHRIEKALRTDNNSQLS